jgi:hypothetical protein
MFGMPVEWKAVERSPQGIWIVRLKPFPKLQAVRTRLTTPEGYTLTARTSLDATMRVAAGEFKPGFQTPSMAFGPDYILGFEGVMREELNA